MKIKHSFLFLSALLLTFGIWACGDALGDGAYRSACSTGVNCTFQGTTTFSGPTTSQNPCPANYTRASVGMCALSGGAVTGIAVTTSCTPITLNATWGIPSTVKTVTLETEVQLKSGTVAGIEQITINYYSDNGCTALLGNSTGVGMPYLIVYSTPTSAGFIVGDVSVFSTYFVNNASTIYAKQVVSLVAGGSSLGGVLGVTAFTDN